MDNSELLPLSYENKNLYQANELVRAIQEDVSLLEAKILRLIMLQVVKNDTDFRTYTCRVVDLAAYLGFARQNVYKEIQGMADRLMKKTITIELPGINRKGEHNYKIIHWLSSFEYQNGIATFRLSDELRPYLLQLSTFTVCDIDEIRALPTLYSIRLYELLKSYGNSILRYKATQFGQGIVYKDDNLIFPLKYLRRYFSCENKYTRNSDFITRVIDSGVKYINSSTVLPVQYSLILTGKEVTHVAFTLRWGLNCSSQIPLLDGLLTEK